MQKLASILLNIAVAENGVACDQQIGAGIDDVRDRIESDAAVDFDAVRQTASLAHLCQSRDFPQGSADELLSAKAGIYRHHQNVMD